MKVKPVIFFLLLCLLLLFSVFEDASAQRKFRFFYGKVIDKNTKTGISNVNFSVVNSTVGTVSGSNGEFSFYIDTIPAIMTVSHIGYATKKVLLDTSTYNMTLYLVTAVRELKEVIISATPHEAVFKDKHYAVLDYEVENGNIYLVVYRIRLSNSELIYKTPGGDTIAKSGALPFTPKKVFRDCLGYLHISSADSVYQVERKGNFLQLMHPVTIRKYDEILSDCVASTEEVLFFKRVTDHGLGTEFYSVNRKTHDRQWISQIRDEKKAKMLRRNPEDAMMLMRSSQPDIGSQKMSESRDVMKMTRDGFTDWMWIRKIIYTPIKSFLYKIGDFICIFNTPNKQMEFYDLAGNYSYKLQLKADNAGEGRWTNDILIDEINLKVYTTFLKNGVNALYEIDLNTGELTKIMSIFHYFPQKIRIHDGYVYYLYDDPQDPDNKMLFRQRL